MPRQAFADRLKAAMKARDPLTISTVRMIIAGLKTGILRRVQKETPRVSRTPKSIECCRR